MESQKIHYLTKMSLAQKMLFKLLQKMQYGKITITDCHGTHVFQGAEAANTHQALINIHDEKIYQKLLFQGSIAAGESYMHGDWDTDNLTKLIEIIIKNTEIFNHIDGVFPKILNLLSLIKHTFNYNSIQRNKKHIQAHYDLGNDFFQQFLDPSMLYSCALFEPESITLSQASQLKLQRICEQLALKSSDHLLEIGTGWGGFALYAAKHYGCQVTTTTISDKQFDYVKALITNAGLTDKITLLKLDYRLLTGKYDKIVSIEMIEAIGHRHFDTYFKQCSALLKNNGLFFLQAILINDSAYERAKLETDYIKKYIFPGGCLPSWSAINRSLTKLNTLQLMYFQDIGKHYATTLKHWHDAFMPRQSQIKQQGFSNAFIRMWQYYFCYCEAAFRQNYITDIHAVWQKREPA